jgi:hypothetical protein
MVKDERKKQQYEAWSVWALVPDHGAASADQLRQLAGRSSHSHCITASSLTMATAKPFTIHVSEKELDDLKQRLDLTRFPDELDHAAWQYGAPLADIKRLAQHWRDGYDWRAQEATINSAMPQFSAEIPVDGFGALNIHFVHKRSQVVDAIPLIFVHGCEYAMPNICISPPDAQFRARLVPGGGQGPPALDGCQPQEPKLPCGCAQPSRIRLLAGASQARIPYRAVCRGPDTVIPSAGICAKAV